MKTAKFNRKILFGVAVVIVGICAVLVGFERFVDELRHYSNVHINDNKDEVVYRLGYPPSVLFLGKQLPSMPCCFWTMYDTKAKSGEEGALPENKTYADFDRWLYQPEDGAVSTDVVFDPKTGRVLEISCSYRSDAPSNECPALAGIRVGDTEEYIRHRLGKYDRYSLERGEKRIRYDDLGIEFRLEKERVYSLTLFNQRRSVFGMFPRYLHSLVPRHPN